MKVLVTGADGFVGRVLIRQLADAGHDVTAAVHPSAPAPVNWLGDEAARFRVVPLQLMDSVSVEEAFQEVPEAVVHLAAVASGVAARQDVLTAWSVNAAGTACLAELLGRRRAEGQADPLLLAVSTGEVYGVLDRPSVETDSCHPTSPYAASKLGGELAAQEVARRTGLRVIVARAYPHTGPGQGTVYAIPAFAERIRLAKRLGAPAVRTGNLDPIRDVLDVRDVARAYGLLLEHGVAGETYNVSRGEGVSLADVFHRLSRLAGARVVPEPDTALMRRGDLPYLVGNSTKLRQATGWSATIPLEQTLGDILNAQAH